MISLVCQSSKLYELLFFFTAGMFFTVVQTGQTKHFLPCLEGESEVRGIQLQYATSPLDIPKFCTLNL